MIRLVIGVLILAVIMTIGFSAYFKFLSNQNIITPGSSQTQDANISSGIMGKILLGPQCPVVSEDQDCEDKPYQTSVIVKTIDGRKVTEFSSGLSGQFKVKLVPGRYWLEAADQSKFPHLDLTPIDVEANKFKEITLHFDTGIR